MCHHIAWGAKGDGTRRTVCSGEARFSERRDFGENSARQTRNYK